MIEIDGSEGGGQLLRSALSFAALTGNDIEMRNVRGSRSTPGLRPQHLAALQLLEEICAGDPSKREVGSEVVTFRPGEISPGEYGVDIETAGSVTLLFDAVLPLATAIEEPLTVTARGGTDVKWSPTMAYYRQTKLPLLRKFGLQAAVDVDRPGFYPTGGGKATLHIAPSTLSRIDLQRRGARTGVRVYSLASSSLSEQSVAQRQAQRAVERFEEAGLQTVERTVRYAESDSPGSALLVRLGYEQTYAGFDALGERGKPAENVADEAVDQALGFTDGNGTVDRHAGDQLLVFLALSAGRLRVPALTDHVRSNRDLLTMFGFELELKEDDRTLTVTSPPRKGVK